MFWLDLPLNDCEFELSFCTPFHKQEICLLSFEFVKVKPKYGSRGEGRSGRGKLVDHAPVGRRGVCVHLPGVGLQGLVQFEAHVPDHADHGRGVLCRRAGRRLFVRRSEDPA